MFLIVKLISSVADVIKHFTGIYRDCVFERMFGFILLMENSIFKCSCGILSLWKDQFMESKYCDGKFDACHPITSRKLELPMDFL